MNFRGDFCSWYVEIAKIRLYNNEDDKKISKLTAQYMLWSILEANEITSSFHTVYNWKFGKKWEMKKLQEIL